MATEKYRKSLAGFERVDNQPLEKNTLFETKAAALDYVENNPTVYAGQIITVLESAGMEKPYIVKRVNATTLKLEEILIGDDYEKMIWEAEVNANRHATDTVLHVAEAERTRWNTAIQTAKVGNTSVPKSGTELQFPAYPTSLPASDKSTILSEAATDAQTKVNTHANDAVKHITATERTLWNSHQTAAQVKTVADESAATAITNQKGKVNGLASLDATGKVPAAQLPSYVDDVVDVLDFVTANPTSGMKIGDIYYNKTSKKIFTATSATVGTESDPETGKIYINLKDLKTYRWSGSDMVVISETIALGETSSTAYRGDRGKELYDWMNTVSGEQVTVQNKSKLNNLPAIVPVDVEFDADETYVNMKAHCINLNTNENIAINTTIEPVSTEKAGILTVEDYNQFRSKLSSVGNSSNTNVTFTEATSRTNIATGEKLSVLFGKVSKWFTDLKALAFKDKVGTADITDGAVTLDKLENEVKNNLGCVEDWILPKYKIEVTLVDESSGKNISGEWKVGRLGKIEFSCPSKKIGIKLSTISERYWFDCRMSNLRIEDEAGNNVTHIFEVDTSVDSLLTYTYQGNVTLGRLYVSLGHMEEN